MPSSSGNQKPEIIPALKIWLYLIGGDNPSSRGSRSLQFAQMHMTRDSSRYYALSVDGPAAAKLRFARLEIFRLVPFAPEYRDFPCEQGTSPSARGRYRPARGAPSRSSAMLSWASCAVPSTFGLIGRSSSAMRRGGGTGVPPFGARESPAFSAPDRSLS